MIENILYQNQYVAHTKCLPQFVGAVGNIFSVHPLEKFAHPLIWKKNEIAHCILRQG